MGKRRRTRRTRQISMEFRCRGGYRKRAGRPRKADRPQVPHRKRPKLVGRFPVHVTYRMAPDVKSLRKFKICRELRRCFAKANKAGFRICQFSVQGNHLHLICEAADERALSRGMQGLGVSVTRTLNRVMKREGSAFADRYHAEQLKSPRQVRNTLCYVLQNGRRHGMHKRKPKGWVDPFSSWRYFDGWRDAPDASRPAEAGPTPVREAETWLLSIGWRRHGRIGLDEMPAAGRPPGQGAAA